jgi:dephospho-CoA kinase
MKIIGVTGGIGSGKSIVCKVFQMMGFPVFFSDQVAKHLMHSNTELKDQICALFGNDAYQDGVLNRPFLAQQIFSDETLKSKLNSIVHPAVYSAFQTFCQKQTARLIFNESALLFETGSYKRFDYTILVTAPLEIKLKRIKQRDLASESEILARMKSQLDDDEKRKLASFELVNDENSLVLDQIYTILKSI